MKTTVVIPAAIRDAANDIARDRNGGDMFTAALADPGDPTTPTHYITSWDTDAYSKQPDKLDGQPDFNLLDQISQVPGLEWVDDSLTAGKTTAEVLGESGGVYDADVYDSAAVQADLGLVSLEVPEPV